MQLKQLILLSVNKLLTSWKDVFGNLTVMWVIINTATKYGSTVLSALEQSEENEEKFVKASLITKGKFVKKKITTKSIYHRLCIIYAYAINFL